MSNLKKYLLILILLELIFSYAPAYAQTGSNNVNYNYGTSAGVASTVTEFLCTPSNTTNANVNPNSQDLFKCVNQLYKFAIVLASVVGVFFIVIAGYIYMSAGDSEGVTKAKDILTSTITALVILMAGYVLLQALDPDLVQFQPIQPPAVTGVVVTGVAPSTAVTGVPGAGAVNTSCNQNFSNVPASTGCSGATTSSNGNCVNVTSYTGHNDPTDCATDNGVCLMSSQGAQRIQNFISTFNSIAQGACTVQIASAIQVINAPSVSSCHSPTASNAGTCADMHIIPYNSTCQQDFYQAAQQSAVVTSFLDEYCSTVQSTTGGNIHVNF